MLPRRPPSRRGAGSRCTRWVGGRLLSTLLLVSGAGGSWFAPREFHEQVKATLQRRKWLAASTGSGPAPQTAAHGGEGCGGAGDLAMLLHTPKVAGTSMIAWLNSMGGRYGCGKLWDGVTNREEFAERCPSKRLCACAARQNVQFLADEVGISVGRQLKRDAWKACGRRLHLVSFFREPVHTALSTFVQVADVDCKDEGDEDTRAACNKFTDPTRLFQAFLDGKLCYVRPALCNNKQSLFAGASSFTVQPSGAAVAAGNCSAARLDAALVPLDVVGIVEAFDVSVCLVAHVLRLTKVFDHICRRAQGTGGAAVHAATRNNVARKSKLLLDLVRANATLLGRVRRAHAVDELLYRHAVARFVADVGRMSRETGVAFELPTSLQRIARQQVERPRPHDDPGARCADVRLGPGAGMRAILRPGSGKQPRQSLAEILALPPGWTNEGGRPGEQAK